MHIHILAVGKVPSKDPVVGLCEEYLKRLSWKVTFKEVVVKKTLEPVALKAAEGALLLDALPEQAYFVALDGNGKTHSSESLTKHIGVVQSEGRNVLAIAIGGAFGHGDEVLKRADAVWSLGNMTWPHRLVRVMLCEQLYRAKTILDGHPYHK